jgi:hypothetical protein
MVNKQEDLGKGEMIWRRGEDGDLHLWLKAPSASWVPYRSSRYSVPDREHFSKGYLTYIALHKLGWTLLKTKQEDVLA